MVEHLVQDQKVTNTYMVHTKILTVYSQSLYGLYFTIILSSWNVQCVRKIDVTTMK